MNPTNQRTASLLTFQEMAAIVTTFVGGVTLNKAIGLGAITSVILGVAIAAGIGLSLALKKTDKSPQGSSENTTQH